MSAEKKYEIAAIFFEADALVISYMATPEDVRVGGAAVAQHQLRLHRGHPDYSEDADDLQRKAVRTLRSALEDFYASEPFIPEEPEDDDDDEKGMGE